MNFSPCQAVDRYAISAMFRNRRHSKEIDHHKLNSRGFEGILKNEAMAGNEGGKEMSNVEMEPQMKMSGNGETNHAGISAPNHSGRDAVEDDVLSAEQEIDARL